MQKQICTSMLCYPLWAMAPLPVADCLLVWKWACFFIVTLNSIVGDNAIMELSSVWISPSVILANQIISAFCATLSSESFDWFGYRHPYISFSVLFQFKYLYAVANCIMKSSHIYCCLVHGNGISSLPKINSKCFFFFFSLKQQIMYSKIFSL